MTRGSWFGVALGVIVVAGVAVSADSLVMKNGNRVSGRLIGVRDGRVEFQEDRGARRTLVLSQNEVRAIEFDDVDDRDTWNGRNGRGGRDRQDGDLGNGRPNGLRERNVEVVANRAWTDTGIVVRAGQTVYFTASGRVRWGANRVDGPEGEANSPRNEGRPIPNRPAASLVGRIGTDAPFFIGNDGSAFRVRSSGPLFLGVNDDTFGDNGGSFRVVIAY